VAHLIESIRAWVARLGVWLGTVRGLARDPARLLLVRVPAFLDPWVPGLADVVADDAWMSGWRGAVGLAPLLGLALGFLAPLRWAGMEDVYTGSLSFMVLAVGGAILSGSFGLSLLLGYVLGDVVNGGGAVGRQFYADTSRGALETVFKGGGSQLIGYMLLAIPVVSAPRVASSLARAIRLRLPNRREALISARWVLFPAACALLIFLWSQGATVLIRPVFTWRDGATPTDAIAPLRDQWIWLVVVAVLASLARVGLQTVIRRHPRWSAALSEVRRLRGWGSARRGELWNRLPLVARIWAPAGAITLLLAGAYQSWRDGALVGLVTIVLGAWRVGIIRPPLGRWVHIVRRVPDLLRLAAALLIGYLGYELPYRLLGAQAPTDGPRSLVPMVLLVLAACYALFPRRPASRGAPWGRWELPERMPRRWPAHRWGQAAGTFGAGAVRRAGATWSAATRWLPRRT
jgi:hypothetical protein